MDFSTTEAAQDLGGLVSTIVDAVCTPEHQRKLDGLDQRFDRELWGKLVDADILSTAAPESLGGGGFGVLEEVAVLVGLGRQLAAVPYLESVVLAAGALARFGSVELQQQWGVPAVSGEKILTVALDGEMGDGPVQAVNSGDGYRLSGTRTQIGYGPVADGFLVPAETDSGTAVFLVAASDPGVSVSALETTGLGSIGHLRLDGVEVDRQRIVGGEDVVSWIATLGVLGRTAFQLGVLDRGLQLTAEYARTREQFDRPIGSFQAVGQRLADGYIDVKGLRLTLAQAAWRLSEDLAADTEVATAAFWAADAGHRVAHTIVHVHGGVGIDIDHPVHRYFLAAKQTEFALGGATGQLLKIGRELADTPRLAVTAALPTVADLLAPLVDIDDRGVYFEGSFVNWRDHLRHGAAVAATLRQRLDPDRPPHVGVLLENTPFFSAVLVAAGMSGIVPVGLNPVRRGAALVRDIDHADCQLVLADTNSAATLGDISHINVDSAAWADEVAQHRDAEVRFQSAGAEDLFMLIFTSGTSGEPKAVKCSHGKVAIAGLTMTDRFSLGPNDVCYASMPLFHSNAVLVGWAVALACRGSMVLRRKFSASQFLPDIRRYGATYANYVGKPLSYVLATPERPDDADNPLRAVYGNEGAPGDIDRFAVRFGCLVIDGFGSTEGGVAIGRTPDTPVGALGLLPDGIEILDVDTGQPCPVGVVGELVNAGGPGRFEGYYNDAEADAQRMAGGVYHSGDLAYRDEAGYAYFVGRLGDWLRVDGENLGTAPIERVLLRYPEVTEVAVYAVPDPAVGDQVMAALMLAPGAEFDADKFRAFLAEQTDLGPKQWPSYVRVSTSLPRTATFKVLKRQLSAEGLDCADPVLPIRR